jgi:carbonic anhydrase
VALDRVQKLTNLYDSYFDCLDEEFRSQFDINSKFRYKFIISTRYDLLNLFTIVFDEASIEKLMIFRQVSVLLSHLDIAKGFHTDLTPELRDDYQSPAEVLGEGRWSFNCVVQTMVPRFLEKYAIEEETKRLYVVDHLGCGTLKHGNDTPTELGNFGLDICTSIEPIAFALVSQLVQLQRSVAESLVRDYLHKLVKDPSKSPEYRRWVKNNGKKCTKRIEQLVKSTREQRALLISCLEARKSAIDSLMTKLEASVAKNHGLPEAVEDQLDSRSLNRRDTISLLTKCSVYVHPWSYTDADEIRSAIMALHDAAETATAFLHHATSQKYPLVKSIFSPSWTQQGCASLPGFLSDGGIAYQIVCIHDIVRLANGYS